MAPGSLELLISGLGKTSDPELQSRLLAGHARNEDACVLTFPRDCALVQTVDILTPIVNDPFAFGRIAACNALSDVYAMGGKPWCAMNIACFPRELTCGEGQGILRSLLEGGQSALNEAEAVLAGGHTVEDEELKYGLSVTGVIDPSHIASNDKLAPGLSLVLTKPLGTGILATALKANWEGCETSEEEITRVCGRLNKWAGEAIRLFKLPAATDVTGFGLIGHALEMAEASRLMIALESSELPFLPRVLDFAGDGLIPGGAYRNRSFYAPHVDMQEGVDELVSLCAYDPQTSGGLLLGVPKDRLGEVCSFLVEHGDEAHVIGEVLARKEGCEGVILRK